MKIYALYLPAFHEIAENNKWWGKGFTEWDNVKNAKKLFKNHYQPKIPLNNNYYDLSVIDDIKKQVELANLYEIDGFISYHYWFSGKKLLEKPMELLLENKDIKINFALCWANEPWARTWDGKDHEILMPQNYGDEKDWENHINYLIEFFLDERYIKQDGHPVLYIYSPSKIPNFDTMITYWNNKLFEKNIKSIYLVEYICTKNPKACSNNSNAVVEFEPMYSNRYRVNPIIKFKRLLCKKFKTIDFMNYDYIWKKIIKNKRLYGNRKIYKGCFVDWDNSPRKGKNATIFKGGNPQKFGYYLKKLCEQKRKNAENIIIINAWNEWGEGAMLETTEKYKNQYLEKIREVKYNREL